jgi:2-haloacid dehalogenase
MDALVFDAYGTLFDVVSLRSACEAVWPRQGEAVSRAWRLKQLEYSWLRTLMGQYVDFERLTADALRYTCNSFGFHCTDEIIDRLLLAYRNLSVFPDAVATLRALGGYKRVILSNGSPAMLETLVRNTGLWGLFDSVISVDAVRLFKPHPKVYQLAATTLRLDADRIGFVSANNWDASGARSFGFRSFWINRDSAPSEYFGVQPDYVLSSLTELVSLVS